MKVTYLHHSGFLVETGRSYYLFDYETGALPEMNGEKPIFVLASHSHEDHWNPQVFSLLAASGMGRIRAVLSDDIEIPAGVDALRVSPEREYTLGPGQRLFTLRSTDLGVAFLIEDGERLIYHAGDLNDWVWQEESEDDNREMTASYRRQIGLLAQKLGSRELDAAFVVLDPRQGADSGRGLLHFLEQIPASRVYPMHYWDDPTVIDAFLRNYPQYRSKIQHPAHCAEKR